MNKYVYKLIHYIWIYLEKSLPITSIMQLIIILYRQFERNVRVLGIESHNESHSFIEESWCEVKERNSTTHYDFSLFYNSLNHKLVSDSKVYSQNDLKALDWQRKKDS